MSDIESRRFGQYELREVLGKGGMATVFRAYQPSLDREVAIKVMSNQFLDDHTFTQRFKREARSIASLHHSNILNVYDTGEENGVPYIVTELVDGKTLRERMGKPMDLRTVAYIIRQIASALDYAHEHGIVHRDIKPSNVLMGHRDRAVLSDFGIVKVLEDNEKLTATGFGVGTPEYMSPEQGTGGQLDGRSDLYSLGVMLYEMLTGVTPYRADTPLNIIMNHINKQLPDPRQYNSSLTPEIVVVLNKALAKNPNDRYQTGAALATAFDEAITPLVGKAASPQPPAADKTQVGGFAGNFSGATQVAAPRNDASDPRSLAATQAYKTAMEQEQHGNYQAAYETLVDLDRNYPNYQDVPTRLASYEQSRYRYTGQQSLYMKAPSATNFSNNPVVDNGATQIAGRPNFNSAATAVSSGFTPPPPSANQGFMPPPPANTGFTPPPPSNNGFIPPVNTGFTPPPPSNNGFTPPPISSTLNSLPGVGSPKKNNTGLIVGIGGAVVVLIAIVIIVLVVMKPSNSTNTTPTVQAVATATAAPTSVAANTTTVASSTTINAATTTTVPADTTTAPATTTSAAATTTTGAAANDPAANQVKAITDKLYSTNGDLKTAVIQLKALVAQYPKSEQAYFQLGQALFLWNHEAGEIDALKTATTLNPNDANAWAVLAMTYHDGYQYPQALDAATQAVSIDSKNAIAHAAMALALETVPDLTRAQTEVDTAIKLDPTGLWPLWAAFNIALDNNKNNSQKYIDQLLLQFPTMATFSSGKGGYYATFGDYDNAISWYQKALQLDPDYPYAHDGLGWAYYDKANYTDAKTEFQKATQLNDSNPDAHDGLGYVSLYNGQYQDAINQFNRSLTINTHDSTAYEGLSSTYLDQAADSKDDNAAQALYQQALAQARSAIQYNSNFANGYYDEGQAYYFLKQYSDAENAFTQAIKLYGNNDFANVHVFLAYAYYADGKTSNAKDEVAKALKLDPNNKDAQDLQSKLGS